MAYGHNNYWSSCGYAIEREGIERDSNGVPEPQVTAQMVSWVLGSQADAFERWGKYDKRILEGVVGMISLLAASSVSGYTLTDGTQFCCSSIADLIERSGWNKKKVEKALHACQLSPIKGDSDRFVKYCEQLRASGEKPYVELIKAGDGKVKSSYRYVGIKPLSSPADPPSPDDGGSVPFAEADRKTVLSDPATLGVMGSVRPMVAGSPKSVSDPFTCDANPQTIGVAGSERFVASDPQTRPTDPQTSTSDPQTRPTDPKAHSVGGSSSTPSVQISISPSSGVTSDMAVETDGSQSGSMKEELYQQFVALFPCKPGNRDGETKAAFLRRIREGYSAQAIVDGARKYWDPSYVTTDGNEKRRFPLTWLQNNDHFCAVVRNVSNARAINVAKRGPRSPRELAESAALTRVRDSRGSYWVARVEDVPGAIGPQSYELERAGDCEKGQARLALELILDGRDNCSDAEFEALTGVPSNWDGRLARRRAAVEELAAGRSSLPNGAVVASVAQLADVLSF